MSGLDEQDEFLKFIPPMPIDLVKASVWFEYRKKCLKALRNMKNPILELWRYKRGNKNVRTR